MLMPVPDAEVRSEEFKIFKRIMCITTDKIINMLKNNGVYLYLHEQPETIKKIFKGAKMIRYLLAFLKEQGSGFKVNAKLKAFNKDELVKPKDNKPSENTEQKPRAICARGDGYMGVCGPLGHYIEDQLFHSHGLLNKHADLPEFAKTHNEPERADNILKILKKFKIRLF